MLKNNLKRVREEFREKYNAKWLKKYKGFENLSKEKAEKLVESMIEMSMLLCSFMIDNQNIDL